VAAAHVASHSERHVAAVHSFRGSNRAAYASRGGSRIGGARLAGTPRTHSSKASVAFGGNSYQARSNAFGGGGDNHRQFAFASHQGWAPGHQYYLHGHHYEWFNNGWFIVDPFALYGYPYYNYGPDYGYETDTVSVQVQQNLAHDGYYNGPIDGVVGPGTSAAIADYQRDNGLRVTGSIDRPLLRSMGI